MLGLPRVDDWDAHRPKGAGIPRGNGKSPRRCNGSNIAIRRGKTFPGGSCCNRKISIVMGGVGIKRQNATGKESEQAIQYHGKRPLAPPIGQDSDPEPQFSNRDTGKKQGVSTLRIQPILHGGVWVGLHRLRNDIPLSVIKISLIF